VTSILASLLLPGLLQAQFLMVFCTLLGADVAVSLTPPIADSNFENLASNGPAAC
jgi:hypothetical protein